MVRITLWIGDEKEILMCVTKFTLKGDYLEYTLQEGGYGLVNMRKYDSLFVEPEENDGGV